MRHSSPHVGSLLIAPALVVAMAAAGLLPLLFYALGQGGAFAVDAYVWRVLAFTLMQAALSTLLSLAVAVPAAHALANRRFVGRDALLVLFAVPQALPAIVVVLALVELYGQAGWMGGVISLYGLGGILLAHVFFNAPLAIRICVEALEAVPPENMRLAQQLGFTRLDTWRHVEWPALRSLVPRLGALIFLLCAASFVVVLTFGGPSATTLEVAIYHSLRLDFDVNRAVTLALLQIVVCLTLVLVAGQMVVPMVGIAPLRMSRNLAAGMGWFGLAAVVLAGVLVVPPLLALLVSGLPQFSLRPNVVWALGTSLMIAGMSASVSLLLAWPMARLQGNLIRGRSILAAIGVLGLIVPPAVMATGWFLALRGISPGIISSIFLISCLNALMALPFSTTILSAGMMAVMPHHDRLCSAFGISGWRRLWRIERPALKRPLLQALLVAFILSFGDLTAVMLLGSQGLTTLPSLIASEMGQYRSSAAQGTALLLAGLCLTGAWLANHLVHAREART